MFKPSTTVAHVIRQTGQDDFADAITSRDHVLAEAAALGFALLTAAVVGKIAVTFVHLFGMGLRHRRAKSQAKAFARATSTGPGTDHDRRIAG